MDEDDILLIESVAHEMMTRLGYQPHIVGVTKDALVFTEEQIAEFKVLNEEGETNILIVTCNKSGTFYSL